ncbi:MAG: protein kinase domain-containing protein [Rhodoferax sp.]
MDFQLDIGYCSATGPKAVNEDFCGARLPGAQEADWGAIAAMADGVSQGGMGREAAQTTVHCLLQDYYATPPTWDTTVALERLLGAHNTWLVGTNQRRRPLLGLSTLTALVLRGHHYTVAHVGDTRAYLLRGPHCECLTSDHVLPERDFAHQLVRAVGLEERLAVDYVQGELQVGDVFVLLSDGVHGVLRERQWRDLLQAHSSAQAQAQALVDAALAAPTRDNASALVLRVQGLQAQTLRDAQRGSAALPVPPLLRPGDVFEGMRVSALVADSGINRLYQVRAGEHTLALKTLHPARAHDPEERAMLVHEAWLAQHMHRSSAARHLVRVHPLRPDGQAPQHLYVLYDWHRGQTLQQWLDSGQRPSVAQCVQWGAQALTALGLLHRQGVIHRDIKPANLHWGEDEVLRLIDLGVALSGRESAAARALHAGTPSYINPEQWGLQSGGSQGEPQPPDARSDLFALGVTLYQMLTGKLPYGEVLPYQVGRYWRDPTPASRHNPQVPIWLDLVLAKAVAREEKQRFETAEEFRLALERGAARPLQAQGPSPLLQRDPTAVWKLSTGVLALINLLLVYWLLFLPK